MSSNFDPSQETFEEYLRRIHLNDKLKMEWINDQKEEERINSAGDDDKGCRSRV
jgi:hypothetical protein|tara:strand:+ start:479 stop:640 length:162 start_codon:yes stop_codon:yes gene_type:complete